LIHMDKALLFIWLLMGHFLFDWLLQTQWMSMNKSKSLLALTVHSFIYAAGVYSTTGLFLDRFPSLSIFVLLFISHILLDDYRFHIWWMIHVKRIPQKQARETLWMIICIDQIWHFLMLFAILYLV
jgi:hypothetical protein